MLFRSVLVSVALAAPSIQHVQQAEVEGFISGDKFSFLAFVSEKKAPSMEKKLSKMNSNFPEVKFGIHISNLNGTTEEKYSITTLPSFILYRPGHQKRFYYDDWDQDTIYEFIVEATSPVIKEITKEKAEELLKAEDKKSEGKKSRKDKKVHPFFILYADAEKDKAVIDNYDQIADELKLIVDETFYIVKGGELKLQHLNKDGLSEWKSEYPMEWWMNVITFPVFSKMTEEMSDLLEYSHNLPVFWYFGDKNKEKREEIKKLAEMYRLKMLFVEMNPHEVDLSIYGQTKAPSASILHPNGRTMYPLTDINNLNADIEKFFKDELKPLVRSSEDEVLPGVIAKKLLRKDWESTLKENPNSVIFVVDSTPYTMSILKRDIAAFMNRTKAVTAFKTFWMNSDTDDVPIEVQFTSVPAVIVYKDGTFKALEEYPTQQVIIDFVKQSFEFEAEPEIPESELPPLEEEEDDDEEDFIEEEEEDEATEHAEVKLTVEQVKELLNNKFVMSTLNEINWKKLFKVGKDFNPKNTESIKKLMEDESFMSLIGPFYSELKKAEEKSSPKTKHSKHDEL